MFGAERKLFFELLQQGRSSMAEARRLTRYRHNVDLCPMLQRKLEQVLLAIERHFSVVYDVQGFDDHGVDVLVVLDSEKEGTGYIGLQVKSSEEPVKGVNKTLKAQYFDASAYYGKRLLAYYILLAWDPMSRAEQIRGVEQAFSSVEGVKVIEPQYVAKLLLLSGSQLSAMASSILAAEDPVLASVRNMTSGWSARELALYVEVLAGHVESRSLRTPEELIQTSFVRHVYLTTQRLFWDQGIVIPPGFRAPSDADELDRPVVGDPWEYLGQDLEHLRDDVDEVQGRFTLSDNNEASLSVAYDFKARHDPSPFELREMLFEIMTPTAGMSPDARARLLAEAVSNAGLDADEAIEALSELLQVNTPELGAEAAFDDVAWLDLAESLL